MSGIKDYTYSYTAARKQRLREELQERQQRCAAQTQAKLAESRRRAKIALPRPKPDWRKNGDGRKSARRKRRR